VASDGHRVAVVGATGAVGQTVLGVLAERDFPIAELVPFASERSVGQPVGFAGSKLPCRALAPDAIDGFDLAIESVDGSISREWAPKLAATGALVIDKSSAWRRHEAVPLVVAGVNDDAIGLAASKQGLGIVASPNCSTMQMVVALAPIHAAVGIEEIVVATYQSVSGTGQNAIEELHDQTAAILEAEELEPPRVYPHRIAFNVLPHVEDFDPDGSGHTGEELKLMRETRKILGVSEAELAISATCVRVPVFNSHSEAVRIRMRAPLSADACRELLAAVDGIVVVDDPARSAYPLAIDAAGRDEVLVGRIRSDLGPDAERCLNLWIVGDNLRKGAATNAVQIAERLSRGGLLDPDAVEARRARATAIRATV
jgi:aspartate-semialdehyde dehydrogenase